MVRINCFVPSIEDMDGQSITGAAFNWRSFQKKRVGFVTIDFIYEEDGLTIISSNGGELATEDTMDDVERAIEKERLKNAIFLSAN